MNFLVVSGMKAIKQAIIGKFMPLGVNIFYARSYEEAERFLLYEKISMVFCDFDVAEKLEDGILFVDEVLEEKKEEVPIIIVVSSKSNRGLVQQLIEKRVKSFLVKPFEEQVLLKRLIDIKQRFYYVDTDKKYYRVTPGEESPLAIYLRSPHSSKLVKGKIKNISLGGASFQTSEEILDGDIKENDDIEKILVKFPREEAEFGGKLLYKLDKLHAVSFRRYNNDNLRILSNYIFDRVTDPD